MTTLELLPPEAFSKLSRRELYRDALLTTREMVDASEEPPLPRVVSAAGTAAGSVALVVVLLGALVTVPITRSAHWSARVICAGDASACRVTTDAPRALESRRDVSGVVYFASDAHGRQPVTEPRPGEFAIARGSGIDHGATGELVIPLRAQPLLRVAWKGLGTW